MFFAELFMEDLRLLNFLKKNLRKQRIFKDRYNPLEELNEEQFIQLYRIKKETASFLLRSGIGRIRATGMNRSLPPAIQRCLTLNILSTGITFRKTGELLGISAATSQAVFWQTIEDLNKLAANFIKFPTETIQISSEFYQLGHIPNIIGCIDGTLIPVLRPRENEHIYVCRKWFHALNVTIVNRADLSISFLSRPYPGNTHDSFVYQNSHLPDILSQQRQFHNCYIIGDSAYPLDEHLLVPFLRPGGMDQCRFNSVIKVVRCSVERTLGLWKGRWRAIDKQGGPVRFQPERAAQVILATAILHNICIRMRVPEPERYRLEMDADADANEEVLGGAEIRERIVQQLAEESRNRRNVCAHATFYLSK